MITGIHTLLYTRTPDAARAFFRDVLKLPHVDAGGGWLIFRLPPAELGIHPVDDDAPADGGSGPERCEMYLTCDDVEATVAELAAKGVTCSPRSDQGWGILTTLQIPGGGTIGLYEPRHPLPPLAP